MVNIECNNQSSSHDPITIGEDSNCMRVLCKECKTQYNIRKDWRGIPFNRQYSEIFRRDTLQPNTNLFYRYYPKYLRT